MAKWALDPTHSSVDFTIRHMMIAKVKGTFHTFTADIEADADDLSTAKISFEVDLASIDTRNADRDNHLRTGDFFEVEKYPKMTFKATNIKKTGSDTYDVTGDLTIKDVTRQETFHVTYEGSGKDPWGNERAGFSAEGKIDRSDYGLTWNAALETGGVLVGNEVKISLEIEALKQ